MTTVFDVLLQALRHLDALVEGTATGGSAMTIVDSSLMANALAYADDHFNEGPAFVVKTTDGLAPQGRMRRITDYEDAAGTVTCATFTDTVDAGDQYALGTKRYPAGQVYGALNAWLVEVGAVPTEDTSLETAADDRDYALPVAAKFDLRQVWLARETAAPYDYEPLVHWRVEPAAGNAVGNLAFPYQPRVGYKIKLLYMARHPAVYADSDYLSDYLGLDWAAVGVALRLARWRLNQAGDEEKRTVQQINDLLQREATAKARARKFWPEASPVLPYSPGT